MKNSMKSCLIFVGSAVLAWASGQAAASIPSPMNLQRAPLFLNSSVDPNVAVTLDDSGSMTEAFIPDSADDNCAYRHPKFYSSVGNRLYYNPNVRYSPPLGPTGIPFGNSPFNAAWYDGYEAVDANNPGDNRQGTRAVDLSTEYFPQRNMGPNVATNATTWSGTRVGHDPRLRPLAPDLGATANLGTVDAWYTNCTNPTVTSIPTPVPLPATTAINANNAWLPFTNKNNQLAVPFASGTTGLTSRAFYFRFTGDPAVAAQVNDPRLYEAVDMTMQSADQQQNFANWYSYYRTRVLMSRTAIARTFGVQDEGLRVVLQNLFASTGNPTFAASTTTFNKFTGAARSAFFQRIYRSPASGSTPNRGAMIRAGDLFRYGSGVTDSRNPYWEGAPLSRELTCRQNFHVHVTDGFTNEGTNPALPGAVSAVRLTTGMTLPDGRAYNTSAAESRLFSNVLNPTSAGCSGGGGTCDPTLARVAFAYWATDLRPDLANNVPPFFGNRTTGVTGTALAPGSVTDPASVPEIYWNPDNDPATWQHMVNYTVGLGVAGLRSFPGDYNALRTGALAWPGMRNNQPEAVDDLWHAGLVSRGGYYSAADPQELVDSLSAALTSVIARRGTASAASVTSSVLQASALAFRTGFDSSDWSGQVFANKLDASGNFITPPEWEAGSVLNSRTSADRVIFTASTATGGGIPFQWSALPTDYRAMLNDNPATSIIDTDGLGADRVEYIRGDRSSEISNGGPFRIRSGLLGAVVNSGAVVVAAPSASYTDRSFPGGPEQSTPYSAFVQANRNRRRLIYVGANDGMLHAFDAGSGVTGFDPTGNPIVDLGSGSEVFAYVPREVAPYLSRLTNPAFEFTPFVDSAPFTRDVFINGRWRTMLVGTLRRGGQGVFALDITNPVGLTEGDADDVVLWEFSDNVPGGERMGFTYGRPIIVRLAHGRWAVAVAGGYNSEQDTSSEPQAAPPDGSSPAGGSSLFILDAQSGALVRRFDFTPSQSRGLTTPAFGDYQGDFIDDFAVSGDLQGNLWRFDFSSANPASWSVERMYRPAAEFTQPVTMEPVVMPDTQTDGAIVIFGTGKYLEPGDRSVAGVPTQSLYGVRDYRQGSPNYPIQPTQLAVQTLTKVGAGASATFTVTNNAVSAVQRGWRMQLLDPGERSILTPTAIESIDIVVLSTTIPNGDDPCLPGLRGNLFALNASSGGAPAVDRNGDGIISGVDFAAPVGQALSQSVAAGTLSAVVSPGGGDLKLLDIEIGTGPGPMNGIRVPTWRRRSWREIQP